VIIIQIISQKILQLNFTKISNKNDNILKQDVISSNFILGLINDSNINTISENKITNLSSNLLTIKNDVITNTNNILTNTPNIITLK